MNRLFLNCSLLAVVFFSACYGYSYRELRLDEKIHITRTGAICENTDDACVKASKKFVFARKKYFCLVMSFSPSAAVNNKAVELAQKEEFTAASILLKTIMNEKETEAAAYNNLGIISELSGTGNAAAMYSRACLLEPNNIFFAKNLASLGK
ncbi:MAG: hypothetical protein FWG92_00545 [Leptospirales bacterium]|nr:hypothetical protein [Leptospirales bacterium]